MPMYASHVELGLAGIVAVSDVDGRAVLEDKLVERVRIVPFMGRLANDEGRVRPPPTREEGRADADASPKETGGCG